MKNDKSKPERFIPPEHWRKLDVSDLWAWKCSALVWVIEDLIALDNLVLMAGMTQARKTLLGLYMAWTIATGGMLFGKFETKRHRVLYVGLEDPDRRFQDRLTDMWASGQSIPDPDWFILHIAPGLSLGNRELFEYLETLIEEGSFEVVFLDTYQKATPGLTSYNDEQQSQILHRLADFTRKRHLAIVIIDHIRKSSGDSRKKRTISVDDIKGTGGKAQNADAVMLVERSPTNQMMFRCSSKDCDTPVSILLDVSPQGSGEEKFTYAGDLDEEGSHRPKKLDVNCKKVLEHVTESFLSSGELAKETGLSDSTVRRTLSELVKRGSVQTNDKNGKFRKYKRAPELFPFVHRGDRAK